MIFGKDTLLCRKAHAPSNSSDLHPIAEHLRRAANHHKVAEVLLPRGIVQELGDAVDLIVVAAAVEAQQLQQERV